MILEYELKAEHIRDCTMKTLTDHITLEANGYRCTPEMIFDVMYPFRGSGRQQRGEGGGKG